MLGIGGLFARVTVQALSIRAHTGSEFATYVVAHHIGTAVISDDASGLQEDFCVLNLTQPIPDQRLLAETMQLSKVYQSLDGGDLLTIEYTPPGQSAEVEASTVYTPQKQQLALDLHQQNGSQRVIASPCRLGGGSGWFVNCNSRR